MSARVCLLVFCLTTLRPSALPASPFLRGDADGSGLVDISDSIRTFQFLFVGGAGELSCEDAADANDDGTLDISDAIAVLGFLFLGNVRIPFPGAASCGEDPTPDRLTCVVHPLCGERTPITTKVCQLTGGEDRQPPKRPTGARLSGVTGGITGTD